jgi:beta-lactamase class D
MNIKRFNDYLEMAHMTDTIECVHYLTGLIRNIIKDREDNNITIDMNIEQKYYNWMHNNMRAMKNVIKEINNNIGAKRIQIFLKHSGIINIIINR